MAEITMHLSRTVFLPKGSPGICHVRELKADIRRSEICAEDGRICCSGEADLLIEYLSFAAGEHYPGYESYEQQVEGGSMWQALLTLPFELTEAGELPCPPLAELSVGELKWFMVAPHALELEMELKLCRHEEESLTEQIAEQPAPPPLREIEIAPPVMTPAPLLLREPEIAPPIMPPAPPCEPKIAPELHFIPAPGKGGWQRISLSGEEQSQERKPATPKHRPKGAPIVSIFEQAVKEIQTEKGERIAMEKKAVAEEVMMKEVVVEKAVAEKAVCEEVVAEKVVAEKVVAEKAVIEEVVAEKVVAEKAVAEKVVIEEAVVEKAVDKEAVIEKVVVEEVVAEKVVAEKVVAEKAVAEKTVAEKSVTEKVATEEAVVEAVVVEEIIVEEIVVEEVVVEERCEEKPAGPLVLMQSVDTPYQPQPAPPMPVAAPMPPTPPQPQAEIAAPSPARRRVAGMPQLKVHCEQPCNTSYQVNYRLEDKK